MGAPNRRPVAGYSRAIPVRQHLLATHAGVAGDRNMGTHMAETPRNARRKRTAQVGRSFRRRNVFVSKKGGECVDKTKRGKGTKLMVVADGHGIPVGLKLASATPHEVTLIECALDTVRVPRPGRGRPRKRFPRLIYDRAADSLALRRRLKKERGVDLICPHRSNRKVKVQDGRKLRRYRRRWKIERTNAWLQNYRRVLVRFDWKITSYFAFVVLACIMITIKRL